MLTRDDLRVAAFTAHRNLPDIQDRIPVVGQYTPSTRVVEAYRNGQHDKRRGLFAVSASNYSGTIKTDWLPVAAQLYDISPNPEDYVLVEVPIVTVDIPNRNMQGFTYEEVTCFNREAGRPVWSTFIGKPACFEHKNDTATDAQGINFDATLRYIPEYDVYKIFVLSGFDRNKNSWLAEQILSGKRKWYSMGALVSAFICSICGSIETDKKKCECMRKYGKGAVLNGHVLWQVCSGSAYDENSSVGDPADITAGGDVL